MAGLQVHYVVSLLLCFFLFDEEMLERGVSQCSVRPTVVLCFWRIGWVLRQSDPGSCQPIFETMIAFVETHRSQKTGV